MIPWNEWIAPLPGAHLLQTWEWGQVKSRYNWRPYHLVWSRDSTQSPVDYRLWVAQASEKSPPSRIDAAALCLVRRMRIQNVGLPLAVVYTPKGPLLDWADLPLRNRVLNDIQMFARQQGALFLKIDPDVRLGTGVPETPEAEDDPTGASVRAELLSRGWRFSNEQIQFRNSVLIDLTAGEAALLAKMRQKTRYNIRLAARRGVKVRAGNQADLDLLFDLYAETAVRDGFAIRNRSYYRDVWKTFLDKTPGSKSTHPMAHPLIAEVEEIPVAAIIVLSFAGKAWFMYGMSRDLHRDKMPNYLLQWEMMKQLMASACHTYDLWGAPDHFNDQDPLWGVYRFKQGFQGTVIRHLGAWDLPIRPALYRLYTVALPRLLAVLRSRGIAHTRQSMTPGS